MSDTWRNLGFYFAFDSRRMLWSIRGSADGIRAFARLLRERAPASAGEHVAIGPHRDLLLIHATPRRIDADGIHGTPDDLALLAELIERKLARAEEGDTFVVDKQYGAWNRAPLEFEVSAAGFVPDENA